MGADSGNGKASLTIGNTLAEMQSVVAFVERFCGENGVPPPATNDLNLCLDELLNNTISYGYDDERRHDIKIVLSVTNGAISAEVTDDAKPFDPRRETVLSSGTLQSRRLGGVGLHFVKTLMDQVGYMRQGPNNVVTITKRLGAGGIDADR